MRRDSAHDIRKIHNFVTCVAWNSSDGKVSLGLPSPSFSGCEAAKNLRLSTTFQLMYGHLPKLWCLGMVENLPLPFNEIKSPNE
jgi:hypothetical protein